jgi:hypothetical protein
MNLGLIFVRFTHLGKTLPNVPIARFHKARSRLEISLRESRRVGGKPRSEHIASLGSVPIPASLPDRVEFWRQLGGRFSKLSNRIGADRGKLIASIHARIPKVTDDDIRTVQRENAEADEKLWSGIQNLNAEVAEGNKALAATASRTAAESEAGAKYAAAKAATAKERIDRLAKGEDVKGGLGKPMTREDYERILKDAGWSCDDINFSVALSGLDDGAEFENYSKLMCELHHRHEKTDRRKVLRKIKAARR